jgi:hypothetical protein
MADDQLKSLGIKPISEITAEDVFEREFLNIKNNLESQKQITWQVIVGVLIAFIAIVAVTAIQVNYSNRKDAQFYSNLEKDIYEQNLKVQDLNNEVDNIKILNPYLK